MADVLTTANFLDQAGVSTLASTLLKTVNVKINDRLVDTIDASSDEYHVLTAAALYALVGTAATATGSGSTIYDAIKANGLDIDALEALVGTTADPASAATAFGKIAAVVASIGDKDSATGAGDTVYDAIKTVDAKVDGLTHLNIVTYVGEVTNIPNPSADKLYFVKSNESDPTWELYIYNVPESGDPSWINVGDTSVVLTDYFKHGDLAAVTDDAIKAAVAAAYTESQDPTAVA